MSVSWVLRALAVCTLHSYMWGFAFPQQFYHQSLHYISKHIKWKMNCLSFTSVLSKCSRKIKLCITLSFCLYFIRCNAPFSIPSNFYFIIYELIVRIIYKRLHQDVFINFTRKFYNKLNTNNKIDDCIVLNMVYRHKGYVIFAFLQLDICFLSYLTP